MAAVAQPEADDRDEREQREESVGDDHEADRASRPTADVEVEPEARARRARCPTSATATSRASTASARRLFVTRRVTKGATAISAAPNRLAPIAAQASTAGPSSLPARTGTDREDRRSRARSRGTPQRGADPCRAPRRGIGSPRGSRRSRRRPQRRCRARFARSAARSRRGGPWRRAARSRARAGRRARARRPATSGTSPRDEFAHPSNRQVECCR